MTVPKDLLEILVCPLCTSDVREQRDELACTRPECGLVFPVKEDIPVMLIEEARRPCPRCSAPRDWDEKSDTLRCPSCGTAYRPER